MRRDGPDHEGFDAGDGGAELGGSVGASIKVGAHVLSAEEGELGAGLEVDDGGV